MSAQDRQEVLRALAGTGEAPQDDSPASLARSATRLEMVQPGALQSALGGAGVGKTPLLSLAAGVVGSAVWGTLDRQRRDRRAAGNPLPPFCGLFARNQNGNGYGGGWSGAGNGGWQSWDDGPRRLSGPPSGGRGRHPGGGRPGGPGGGFGGRPGGPGGRR